jgi:uncharacterized membrane protein
MKQSAGGGIMNQSGTSTGLQENVAGLLCYLGLWLTGIIFLILEPKNMTIRFHAVQSIIVFGALSVISFIFGWIPVLGWIILAVVWVLGFIFWVLLMYKAYNNVKYKAPFAGDIAEKIAK